MQRRWHPSLAGDSHHVFCTNYRFTPPCFNMFTLPLIEDTVLLATLLIDAAVIAILLLTILRMCSPVIRTSIIIYLLAAILFAFISLREHLLRLSEPYLEHFRPAQ